MSTEPKSRAAFIILAVLFGSLGIHNFYAGHTKKGLIKLLCTLLTAFILALPMFIWAIIEACQQKQDANGVVMV